MPENLKIVAFDDPKNPRPQSEGDTFMVDFNPNTFTINNTIEFEEPKTKGAEGGDPVFKRIAPLDFTIEFTIDGTGVALQGLPDDVQKKYTSQKSEKDEKLQNDYVKNRIKELRSITGCQINGKIHRPNYLNVMWGTFNIECILTALNITYNLFDKNGSPLRAKVSCSFKERIAPGKSNRKSALESPDLTKYKPVLQGDILPFIVKKNYDDAGYYIQVARANKLKNFRKLVPGTRLVLPAINKN